MGISSDITTFSKVVEKIYDAALDMALWPDTLQSMAELHQAVRAFMYTPLTTPEAGGYLLTHDPVQMSEFQRWSAKYGAMDPWVEAVQRKNLAYEGNSILSQDLLPDEELVRHPFYTEFLYHHNARHLCSGVVFLGREPELPTVVASVHGAVDAPPFDEENRHIHGLLLRHLSRAVGVMTKLRNTQMQLAANLAALNILPGAVLLLNETGHVLFANAAAQNIFARHDSLSLRATSASGTEGRLQAHTDRDTRQLQAQLTDTLSRDLLNTPHFGPGLAIPKKAGEGHWVVRMAPLTDKSGSLFDGINPKAIAFITDSAANWRLDATLLRNTYGLTDAEARVAQALVNLQGVQQVAEQCGTTENTVKTQLKAIFSKTGTHSQAQLLQLLMNTARHQ